MEYILKTDGLTKRYGKKITAVDHVNIRLKQGEIYGFIGRNGAGKTTTMKMICGLAGISEGTVSLFGKTGREAEELKSRIGCLIENPGLYPNMTAYENVKAKCICIGIKKKGYIEDILKIVGLSDTGKKQVKNFSLGMKQRLGIALALVGDPDILMLDEPINGLDPQGISEVRDTILRLNKERNITVFISSHILEELSKVCTCYGIIEKGRLVCELSHDELMDKCKSCVVIMTDNPEAALPVLDKMGYQNYKVVDKTTIEIYDNIDNTSDVIQNLASSMVSVSSVYKKNESVEDFFLHIISDGEE